MPIADDAQSIESQLAILAHKWAEDPSYGNRSEISDFQSPHMKELAPYFEREAEGFYDRGGLSELEAVERRCEREVEELSSRIENKEEWGIAASESGYPPNH